MNTETFVPPFQHPLISNDATNPGFDAYTTIQNRTSIPSVDDNDPQRKYDYRNPQESEEHYVINHHQPLEYVDANTVQTYLGGHESYGNGAHGTTRNTTQTSLRWVGNKNKAGAIVEEAFLDPNRVTPSGAPTMADTKPCIKKHLVRNLIPILIGYLILAANHNPVGAVEAQVLMVQAISDHFMVWTKEQIRCAIQNILASSFYCLWFPISHFPIYSATKLLMRGQAISPAQMGLMEATHAIFVVVDPISTSLDGGHTHHSYVSAIILAQVLVQWARHNGVGEHESDTLAIKNIAYQLVDSDMASSMVAVLLITLKTGIPLNLPLEPSLGVGVHIEKHTNNNNDFDIMLFGLSHASSVGM
ncbi:hypothetical protein EV421DRAFT_1897962 [Armillaria borealis]|uniref:Uncharacterized protein n=1 Tax=Armillaria borealis TaxID=47425 RepID=A0AA39K3R1_9AGAR|nr:hypothetical protein EV421DRAFT_1897962 [Armillaria borealis]